MELVKTIQDIRQTINSLNECQQFALNETSKQEYKTMIQELQLLEYSLTPKQPMSIDMNFTTTLPATTTNTTNSTLLPSDYNDFRVMSRQRNLESMPAVQYAALQRNLNPNESFQQVQRMNDSRSNARIQSLAAQLLPDIRNKLYGQTLTTSQLRTEIKRWVSNSPVVETKYIDSVVQVILSEMTN